MKNIAIPLFHIALCTFLVGGHLLGQRIDIAEAKLNSSSQWYVEFLFAGNPDESSVADPTKYIVLDVLRASRIPVIAVMKMKATNAVQVLLDPSARLEKKRPYHVYITGLSFGGQQTAAPLEEPLSIDARTFEEREQARVASGQPPQETSIAEKNAERTVTAANGRGDSNLYVSGLITGASGQDVQGSVDIKFEYPRWSKVGSRWIRFAPAFDLKASTDPRGDPDSLKLGFDMSFFAWRYAGDDFSAPFRRLWWLNSAKIESNREFDNTNLFWESRFTLLSKTYISDSATFYWRPFFGHELGANLKSPLAAAEGRFLYRPLAGATLGLLFPVHSGLQGVSLEASYIRRWPLRRETTFTEDGSGQLQLARFGKGPKDYLKTGLNLDITKALAATLSYEYGELPPLYKLVDHKFGVGLTYKIKWE